MNAFQVCSQSNKDRFKRKTHWCKVHFIRCRGRCSYSCLIQHDRIGVSNELWTRPTQWAYSRRHLQARQRGSGRPHTVFVLMYWDLIMPLIDVEKQQRIGGHLWNITDLTDEIILNSNQHTPFCLQVKTKSINYQYLSIKTWFR